MKAVYLSFSSLINVYINLFIVATPQRNDYRSIGPLIGEQRNWKRTVSGYDQKRKSSEDVFWAKTHTEQVSH